MKKQNLVDRNVQLIRDVEKDMRAHYAKPLTLQHMEEHCYLSASSFFRLFTQVNGCNDIDRLSEIRLQESECLLRETDMRVYEIASAEGYRKNRYFSELFKGNTTQAPVSTGRAGGIWRLHGQKAEYHQAVHFIRETAFD